MGKKNKIFKKITLKSFFKSHLKAKFNRKSVFMKTYNPKNDLFPLLLCQPTLFEFDK